MPTENIKSAYLVSESPKKAFYSISIEKITDGYVIRKESGANGRTWHREAWFREGLAQAERLFWRILIRKTTPRTDRARLYRVTRMVPESSEFPVSAWARDQQHVEHPVFKQLFLF